MYCVLNVLLILKKNSCFSELTAAVSSAQITTNTITIFYRNRFANEERPCPPTCPPTFYR